MLFNAVSFVLDIHLHIILLLDCSWRPSFHSFHWWYCNWLALLAYRLELWLLSMSNCEWCSSTSWSIRWAHGTLLYLLLVVIELIDLKVSACLIGRLMINDLFLCRGNILVWALVNVLREWNARWIIRVSSLIQLICGLIAAFIRWAMLLDLGETRLLRLLHWPSNMSSILVKLHVSHPGAPIILAITMLPLLATTIDPMLSRWCYII